MTDCQLSNGLKPLLCITVDQDSALWSLVPFVHSVGLLLSSGCFFPLVLFALSVAVQFRLSLLGYQFVISGAVSHFFRLDFLDFFLEFSCYHIGACLSILSISEFHFPT